jgi:hypothetical protein
MLQLDFKGHITVLPLESLVYTELLACFIVIEPYSKKKFVQVCKKLLQYETFQYCTNNGINILGLYRKLYISNCKLNHIIEMILDRVSGKQQSILFC